MPNCGAIADQLRGRRTLRPRGCTAGSHGLSNATPVAAKSAALRVTTVMLCTIVVAAIGASRSNPVSSPSGAAQRCATSVSAAGTRPGSGSTRRRSRWWRVCEGVCHPAARAGQHAQRGAIVDCVADHLRAPRQQVRNGVIEIRPLHRDPREGRAEDARRVTASGDDALVWPEFGNEGDGDLVWRGPVRSGWPRWTPPSEARSRRRARAWSSRRSR